MDKNIVQEKLIKKLTEENEKLKEQLELKEQRHQSVCDDADMLLVKISEYEKQLVLLIDKCKKVKKEYEKETKELHSIKTKYIKRINKQYENTKKQLDNINK